MMRQAWLITADAGMAPPLVSFISDPGSGQMQVFSRRAHNFTSLIQQDAHNGDPNDRQSLEDKM